MIEQPFLLLSFSPILHLAFSITKDIVEFENDKRLLKIEYLLSSSSSFDGIFSLDTIDAFLLVVHFAFNFCFVKAINDNIFTFGNMY